MTQRTVTLGDLRDRALDEADWQDDSDRAVTTTQLDALINRALGELHEEIVTANEDHVVTTLSLTLTGSSYALPDDTFRIRGVSRIFSGGETEPIERLEFEARGSRNMTWGGYPRAWNLINNVLKFYPLANAPGSIQVDYLPSAQVLSGSTDELNNVYTFNGIDEFLDVTVGMKILMKKDEPYSHLEKRVETLKERIRRSLKRDATGLRKVAMIEDPGSLGDPSIFGNWR